LTGLIYLDYSNNDIVSLPSELTSLQNVQIPSNEFLPSELATSPSVEISLNDSP